MISEIKELQCTRDKVRSFGLILGGLLLAFGLASWWKGKPAYPYWLAAGTVIFTTAACFTLLLRPLYKGWMTVALLIGWGMTHIILGVLFYAVVTPIGILHRLTNKNMLSRSNSATNTYWIRRSTHPSKKSYENQF